MTTAPISASVELRATEYILKGMDILEAVKQALVDEIDFASELVSGRSDRSKVAKDYLFNRHCKRIGKQKTKGVRVN